MKRCHNCGHHNSNSAVYCANCGAELGPSSTDTLQIGQTMNNGQYRIVRRLGAGGMGAIYLAQNTQAFDRLCVVKEMLPYYQTGEEQRAQERFEQEARTLATLKHPSIPDMYGFFSERGHNYIVMEYIEGEDLEEYVTHESRSGDEVAAKELSAEESVRYTIQICRVLEYLAGIQPEPVVHCDIKPANIIVERNSQLAVLVDFGTAKARYLRRPEAAPDPGRDSVYGTVGYAAPEMYRGQAVPKSDVFSLAATLYHLLTDNDPADQPFKWPQMGQLPPSLAAILERALAPEPDRRLDAAQFRQELETYRAAQAESVPPLAFPEGNAATTLTGVLDLSLRYWEHARQMLSDGTLETWLRETARDAAAAERVSTLVREHPDAPDAALDRFVREFSPRLPPAQLTLAPALVELAFDRRMAQVQAEITLRNEGPGGSHGTISASEPWLQLGAATFALAPSAEATLRLTVARREIKTPQAVAWAIAMPQEGNPVEAEVRVTRDAAAAQAAATPRGRVAPPISRPRAQRPARGTILGLPRLVLYGMVAAVVIALGAVLAFLLLPGSGRVDRGVAAAEAGDWPGAIPLLADLSPQDDARVVRIARLLDGAMVTVPAGVLQMGSDRGAPDQQPEQAVDVAAFAIDRFEVTNAQYQRFVAETGHAAPRHWSAGRFPRGDGMRPVVGVSWGDALAYAQWAGKRLPTEAEWEWAARGAEGRLYPWGDEADARRALVKDNREARGANEPAPVGSYPGDVTPLGIYDLAGNVREWTADPYDLYRVPHAPPSEGARIAVRGSSWDSYHNTAAARSWQDKADTSMDLGFRCAR